MARLTQAQRIENHNVEYALEFFEKVLDGVQDPRRPQGVRYPLRTVVISALMAMVCGCDNAEAMEQWSEINSDWLAEFLEMPHGTPSQDVYLSVFGALDPNSLSSLFRTWAQYLASRVGGLKHIAVDGKTSRRSADKGKGISAIHTVSAWHHNAGLVLGQQKTEEKSNEITAIPELLKVLDIRNATITSDSIGCQTKIVKTILDGEGDFFLAVKDNQPTLHQDIINIFKEADDPRRRSCDELPRPEVSSYEQTNKGHGRVEKRRVRICRDLEGLTTTSKWPGLAVIAEVTRERTVLSTGKTTIETAHYIGSHKTANAEMLGGFSRNHWGIENSLHWVLDMAFREDEARHRANNCGQNFTTMRHFALNIIKQDPNRKVGIALCRQRAGWDRDYLLELLTRADAAC